MDSNIHNLMESLRRINFIFQNETVETNCLTDLDGFDLLGFKLNSFKKGKKYKLPFFLALPLIEMNFLEISNKDKCDHLDVQRYAINERDQQMLIEQEHKFLFNKIKEFKKFLINDVKKGFKTNMAMDNFNSYFSNIVDTRLLKVIKLANSEFSLEDENKLTLSERILVDNILNIIKTWRNYFLE